MADIFISYAHEDERRVRPLVDVLEKQRWSVFWDRRIPAGQTWQSYIGVAFSQARCVIVVWSHHSVESDAVLEEAGAGMRSHRLVPVRLDAVDPPVGSGLRSIQFADLTELDVTRASARRRQLLSDIGVLLKANASEDVAEPAGRRAGPRRPSRRTGSKPGRSAAKTTVAVGEVRFPNADVRAHEFWDGDHLGPREISVPVAFELPFAKPPKVIVSLREIDLGDVKANIHRLSVRAENVRADGFDLCFATWAESQIYGAVASWIAVCG